MQITIAIQIPTIRLPLEEVDELAGDVGGAAFCQYGGHWKCILYHGLGNLLRSVQIVERGGRWGASSIVHRENGGGRGKRVLFPFSPL